MALHAMSYEHDIFFSYKRDPRTDHWYQQVEEKLRLWVGHERGTDPVIWVDKLSLPSGAQATPEIHNALKRSKCMVSFWTPPYFRSKWCMTEWSTFLHRGDKFNRPLILPASVYDGDTFPPRARDTQHEKFNDYFKPVKIFWEDPRALHFEDQLKAFAVRLAAMLDTAPPFEDFEIIEATPADLQPILPIGRIADA